MQDSARSLQRVYGTFWARHQMARLLYFSPVPQASISFGQVHSNSSSSSYCCRYSFFSQQRISFREASHSNPRLVESGWFTASRHHRQWRIKNQQSSTTHQLPPSLVVPTAAAQQQKSYAQAPIRPHCRVHRIEYTRALSLPSLFFLPNPPPSPLSLHLFPVTHTHTYTDSRSRVRSIVSCVYT